MRPQSSLPTPRSKTRRSKPSPSPRPLVYIDLTGSEPIVRPYPPSPDQEEPPASPVVSGSTDVPPKPGSRQPPAIEDALQYMQMVEAEFQNGRPELYDQFLATMSEFKRHSINMYEVIKRVATLFEGRPALLNGFNMFLPEGFTMDSKDPLASSDRIATRPSPKGTSEISESPDRG